MELKILSYNLHKGFTLGNLEFVLADMREAIRDTGADLVFLQEVKGDQFEWLADQVWHHYSYGKNAVYSSGNHGNAILSKYPFDEKGNTDISTNRLEKRGLLHGVVHPPDHKDFHFHVMCTHLNLFEGGRKKQVETISRYINKAVPPTHPLILAGDFNDWQQKASQQLEDTIKVKEAFKLIEKQTPKTFPSPLPLLRVDRIYLRGFEVLSAQVLKGPAWAKLSDHLPLLTKVRPYFSPPGA